MTSEEQVRFREHLAGCELCSEEFRETLQLDLLGQVTLEEGPVRRRSPAPVANVVTRPWWRHRRVGLAAGGVLAASLLALVLVLLFRQGRAEDASWLIGEGGRPLEARLTYAVVDQHYRRHVPERSGAEAAAPVTALPLHELSRMEARKDLHGIATAYLLYGAPVQARAFLEQMASSTARDSDLAVIALERAREARLLDFEVIQQKQADLEEALQLLDDVLGKEPAHPQALWNRALVLRELGLTLLAAEDFEAVAKLGEPGWSEEAWGQARRLRDDTQARGREWTDVSAMMKDLLAESDARLPLDEARTHPGLVRRTFYDAVRSATSRDDVLRLLPLARVLDAPQQGGEGAVLEGYVQRVAARDFSRRGPAARRYGRLARGELPVGGEWMEELRRSGEEDLVLGALVRASEAGQAVDVALLWRLAAEQGDAWLTLQAELAWAQHDARDTKAWWKAEQRLRTALDACQGPVRTDRCLALERELTHLYLELHRPAEAFQYAWSGWEHAKAAREWRFEQEFLQALADVTRFQHAFASARAYLEESLARMPEDCESRTRVHRTLASVEWERFRPDDARRTIDRALACERPLGLPGATVLSDLARARPEPGDGAALRRALTELRRGGMPPAREALLLFIEGQFELSRSLASGQAQLWRAVELAEQWPDEADAREARAYAYGALIAEAARGGNWGEALALQGRQLRLAEVPERCMLSVSLHHERTVVVVRGPSGRLRGHYDASRTGPPRTGKALVPGHLVEELRACGHVDVLALPPVHGLTELLPVDLAWSYRVGRRAPPGPPPPFGSARHLVVTDVADPPSLKLPRLPPLQPPRVPDPWRLVLRGPQATPSNVLEAMEDASEVELHAHGLFSSAVSDASLVVLAPDVDGRYALTADRVRQVQLSRAPVVLLATCSAARTAPYVLEPFSLPVAFIEAGASVVLASTTDIPDTAGAFFEEVRELIRCKIRPSVALRDARARWLKEHPGDKRWLAHVLLFE